MKKSNFLKMLPLVIFTLLFSSIQAQSDSVCFTSEQARIISEALIDGRNCQLELADVYASYSDAKKEIDGYKEAMKSQKLELLKCEAYNEQLKDEISNTGKKIKRRNTAIIILTITTILVSSQL